MTSFSCSAIPGDTFEFNPMSPGHPPPVTSDRFFVLYASLSAKCHGGILTAKRCLNLLRNHLVDVGNFSAHTHNASFVLCDMFSVHTYVADKSVCTLCTAVRDGHQLTGGFACT